MQCVRSYAIDPGAGGARRRPPARRRCRARGGRGKGKANFTEVRLLPVSRTMAGRARRHRSESSRPIRCRTRRCRPSCAPPTARCRPTRRRCCRTRTCRTSTPTCSRSRRDRGLRRRSRCSTTNEHRTTRTDDWRTDARSVPPFCLRAPIRLPSVTHRSSTSRSLLQPAQQIITRLFSACSSSVRIEVAVLRACRRSRAARRRRRCRARRNSRRRRLHRAARRGWSGPPE